MNLLIRKLDDERHLSIALHVAKDPNHIEHNRIARFETIQHSLEIRQRTHRSAIDASDDVALADCRLTTRSAQLGYQAVGVDILHVKSLNPAQVQIGEQRRCQLCECNAEMERVAARFTALWRRTHRSNPFACVLNRPLGEGYADGFLVEFAVGLSEES